MLTNASIWKQLNPHLSIDETSIFSPKKNYFLSKEKEKEQIDFLKKDGYCYIPSLIQEEVIDTMRSCIESLIQKKIPPVFCFVYDIFWQLLKDLDPVLTFILGKEYEIIPNVWTWYVDSTRPFSYFPPHRDVAFEDFIDEEKMPTLFSLWIPLTDVTTHHSCIHLLPGSLDPSYPDEAKNWFEKEKKEGKKTFSQEELMNFRALPSPKGSFLGWNAGVFHWASKPHEKSSPRISIGFYFHAKKSLYKYPHLIDLKKPFPLEERLFAISNALQMYGKSLSEVQITS